MIMAFPSTITTTITGAGNQGLQVGYNSGFIETHIHAPGKCLPGKGKNAKDTATGAEQTSRT
jgi:hypothetical protein